MHCVRNSSLSLCCGVQQPDAASFFYSHLFSLNSSLQLTGKYEELMIYNESCLNLSLSVEGLIPGSDTLVAA